jgi:hypothetical protein
MRRNEREIRETTVGGGSGKWDVETVRLACYTHDCQPLVLTQHSLIAVGSPRRDFASKYPAKHR